MSTRYDVELIAVTKRFGAATAVDNIALRIPERSYCCLLGPSGCGKTTTLRLIAGHESVSSGDILTRLPPAKRGTAMMFQNYALFPHLNCIDNVAFGLENARCPQNGASSASARISRSHTDDGVRRSPSISTFRRPAAACGARARVDHQAESAAARRAAFGARPRSCAVACARS